MSEAKNNKIFLYLSIPLAALIIISTLCGLFIEQTYFRETANWRVQGIAQDFVDLFIIVPVLILSGIKSFRQHRTYLFIFGRTTLFLVYTYAIYCFSVHFNFLFLIYCITLGLSVYSFIYLVLLQSGIDFLTWFDERVPVKPVSIFFLVISILFYLLWLKDVLPSIFSKATPASLIETGLLTNPVHVLDLSIVLPGMFMLGLFLRKRRSPAFLLSPMVLFFCVLMDISIAILAVVMNLKNISTSLLVAYIMGILAILSSILFFNFLRHLKKTEIKPV